MKTIFEKIIDREIPAEILYEDNNIIAFLDISSVTKGHTLVVPKKPYQNFFAVPNELYQDLFEVVKKVSRAIEYAYGATGFNLIHNCGEVAGQSVFHFHLHIIPRYNKDEFRFEHGKSKPDFELLKKRASKIKDALNQL